MIMKKTILFCSVLLLCAISYGQAYEGTVEYQKKQQSAAVIELPYPPSVVNAAMNDFLSKKGRSKGNDIKGFTTFRNTQPASNDSSNADLYFKTERKSRKQKDITMVSLLLAPVETSADSLTHMDMNEAKTYLNSLAGSIGDYGLEQNIKDQNDAVIRAEAKYKSLQDDGEDLLKKQNEIARKIESNRNDVQSQAKEVEQQKQKLAQMVGQRRS